MAKHRAPRKPFWTLLGAGTIALGLTAASLASPPTVYDTSSQVTAVPVGGVEVGDGSYDLTHEDTSDTACWVEKWQDVTTAETICGPRGLRPAGSVELGTEVAVSHQMWVATMAGLEPVPTN